jgi:hypothetical protein
MNGHEVIKDGGKNGKNVRERTSSVGRWQDRQTDDTHTLRVGERQKEKERERARERAPQASFELEILLLASVSQVSQATGIIGLPCYA